MVDLNPPPARLTPNALDHHGRGRSSASVARGDSKPGLYDFGVLGLEFRVLGLGLGFGALASEFGVLGMGFGLPVWGFGLKVRGLGPIRLRHDQNRVQGRIKVHFTLPIT